MRDTLGALTVLVGVISVVSFGQRVFDVGLVAISKDVIEYYREIVRFLFAMPMGFLGITVPPALTDAWALSFVGASAYARTPRIEKSRLFRKYPRLTRFKYWKSVLLVLFGLSGVGLLVLLGAITPSTYVDEFQEEPLNLSKGAARNALYIFGGALAFFVLNAFAPSV